MDAEPVATGNDDDTAEIDAWLVWLRAPNISPGVLLTLAGEPGGLRAALAAGDAYWQRHALPIAIREWLARPDRARIDADRAWLARPHHHLIRATDERFPAQLREIPDSPAALFVVGDPWRLWSAQLAIVGARTASVGGEANARHFAQACAAAGVTVTSGLARGIDGAAHLGALDAGGMTIAVLGTGVDVIYPRAHGALAARIAAQGVLVSEFSPGTEPHMHHFPRRNRLISGLSLGTLVIEAGLQSGSLITARLAAEQSREVFALPGSIHHPLARGCHRLLRDGARLVEDVDEVLAALAPAARRQGLAIGAALAADGPRRRTRRAKGPNARPEVLAPPAPPHRQPPRPSGPSPPPTRPPPAHRPTGPVDPANPRGLFAPAEAIGPDDPVRAAVLAALAWDPLGADEVVARSGLTPATVSSMLLWLELEGAVAAGIDGRYARVGHVAGLRSGAHGVGR
jgi:DNA processing protein